MRLNGVSMSAVGAMMMMMMMVILGGRCGG